MTGEQDPVLVDVRGLNCPIPLLKTKKALALAAAGASVTVLATDPDSVLDIRAFAQINALELSVREESPGLWRLVLRKL